MSATKLGYKHLDVLSDASTKAVISLSSQPKNYRLIWISHGFYDSGFPSYSSTIIPVSLLDVAIETFFS
jgi:hypothetical protein